MDAKKPALILIIIAIALFTWHCGAISATADFCRKVADGLAPMYAVYDLLVDLLGVDHAVAVIEWIEWVEAILV